MHSKKQSRRKRRRGGKKRPYVLAISQHILEAINIKNVINQYEEFFSRTESSRNPKVITLKQKTISSEAELITFL